MTERDAVGEEAASVIVFGVGNESRGDDALAPMLLNRLQGVVPPGVRVVLDFQLQLEHALDLGGAHLALFVDAARGLDAPFSFRPVFAEPATPAFSHALVPAGVLAVYERVEGRPAPPAFVLGIRGREFGLGEGLSSGADAALDASWAFLQRLFSRPQLAYWSELAR